jgi:hypothetical protein
VLVPGLETTRLAPAYQLRVTSLLDLIDAYDGEVDPWPR